MAQFAHFSSKETMARVTERVTSKLQRIFARCYNRYWTDPASAPTVFHITHFKAGSQWVYKILQGCVPGLIVPPVAETVVNLRQRAERGKVYPGLVFTRDDFVKLPQPPRSHIFVVLRDLRDTLVSYYFSMKISHPVISDEIRDLRARLQKMGQEEGMLSLMKEPSFIYCSRVQQTWMGSGEMLIRYEDLLERDVEILESLLIDRCGLQVPRWLVHNVILANRFERLTKNRRRGEEDVAAHERKGIAGDWRNHFTDRIKDEFKSRFGEVLVQTGYEPNLKW